MEGSSQSAKTKKSSFFGKPIMFAWICLRLHVCSIIWRYLEEVSTMDRSTSIIIAPLEPHVKQQFSLCFDSFCFLPSNDHTPDCANCLGCVFQACDMNEWLTAVLNLAVPVDELGRYCRLTQQPLALSYQPSLFLLAF